MGMNGSKGRARTLARIDRKIRAEAKAAGIDVNDRAAFRAWCAEESRRFHERLRQEAKMTTLEQLRQHKRVEHVDVEDGSGVIVTLRQGWSFDPRGDNRVAGEDTATKALELVRSAHPFSGPFTD